MKKRLITSALPYVNNIPHLGNLIQVLSADVFARWCRLAGYETLYICGTDEYGTATETRAMEEGVTPKELCDRYHTIHKDIYDWFEISFNHFGRTSRPKHTEITQGIFLDIEKAGFVSEQENQQVYCADKDMFLADRFVRGTCPHCGYGEARGDQCENCGKLLDPSELIKPFSPICPGELTLRPTTHLYIDLPKIRPLLEKWVTEASAKGFWSTNAIKMTEAWIRDGLKERAITRDLKWGIPVPRKGFEKKVFYVWFDAPIGYISMTADHTPDWESWWKNPDGVELFQFIGKDNIPFHTVVFPSTLLGSEQSGTTWTKLHHMSSTEYLNYESGKFSKSHGVGVFGDEARNTGIPADVWRFYLFFNRPETSDTLFAWKDFGEKVNSELIGNFSNLVNRTLTFATRYFPGEKPVEGEAEWKAVCDGYRQKIWNHYERADLRDALHTILEWSALGNKRFQEAEPWKLIKTDEDSARRVVGSLCYLVRDLAVLIHPVLPQTSEKILGFFGVKQAPYWAMLEKETGVPSTPEILFQKLEADRIEVLRAQYSGTQKERTMSEQPGVKDIEVPKSLPNQFRDKIRLVCAKIIGIERHPEAEKLYIERLDVGALGERTIVSGLVPFYKEEELLGKTIVLVANLKPAKLRGVLSEGMLLAASKDDKLEVLFPEGSPGTPVVLLGDSLPSGSDPKLNVDQFFAIPLAVKDHLAQCGGLALSVDGKEIRTLRVDEGEIG